MNTGQDQYKYFAFISYSHQDKKWGDWLHKALETYKIPKRLIGTEGRDGVVPKRAFPIFRDREELPGSADLGQNINDALQQSRYLVVICSPRSAQSMWVNEEIKSFKAMGREDRVLCLIVDGEPNAAGKPEMNMEECFPEAVKFRVDAAGTITNERTEPIAADARAGKDGKSNARLKLLAGVLGVAYDALKQRDQARRMRRLQILTAASLLLMTTLTFLSVGFYQARNEAEIAREVADNERGKAEIARSDAETSRDIAEAQRGKAVQARDVADSERTKALLRLKENYRHLGHQAFLEEEPENALLYFNEVRRIDKNEKRINLEMADAWASVSSLEQSFPADEQEIRRIDFSTDGARLLSQDANGRIRLLDIATGEILAHSNASGVYPTNSEGHHFAETSRHIAVYQETSDPDKPGHLLRQVKILDSTGKSSGITLPNLAPDLLNMSPQGTYLLTSVSQIDGPDSVGIWSFNAGKPFFQSIAADGSARNYTWRFSADDQYLFQIKFSGDAPFYIHRRDASNGKILDRFQTPHRVEVSAMHNNLSAFGCADGSLQIYNTTDGSLLWMNFSAHSSNITSLTFSLDGKRLLSVDNFGKTALWDISSLNDKPIWQIDSHEGVANAAELSADGQIAAVAHDKSLSVYRVGQDLPLFFQDNHDDQISDIRLSASGEMIAVATVSGEIKIWNILNGDPREVVTKLPIQTRRVAQNRDESFLAYGDDLYGVWPVDGKIQKIADSISYNQTVFVEDSLIVDYNYGWMSVVKYSDSGIVARNDLKFETDWTGIASGLMGVPGRTGSLAFVYAAPGDNLYGFNRDGQTLPQAVSIKKIRGNPSAVVFNADGSKGAISFTDHSLLYFSISDQGVTENQWHILPAVLKQLRLVDWIEPNNTLLLQSGGVYYLYNLKKEKLHQIQRRNIVAATGFNYKKQSGIASINVQGTFEVWDSDGGLKLQHQLARGILKSNELFKAAQLNVGQSIFISSDSSMVAGSINDRAYIWDVATGELLWRSNPLETSFDNRLTVKGFVDQDRKLIVSTKQGTTLVSLTLGGKIPSLTKMDQYLKSNLKLSLQEGHIVEQK